MLTKPFKPLALAFLVNLIISVEDKIKYKVKYKVYQLVRRIKAINSSVLKTFDFVKSCPEKQKSLEVASTEKRLLKKPKGAQNLDLDMPIPQSPRILARSKAIFVWYYLKYLNISCNTAVINAGAVL